MNQTDLGDLKFEQAVGELEAIVRQMEEGNLELAASISAYERGMHLIQHCQQQLTQAENQIRILEEGVMTPYTPEVKA